MLRVGLTGGPGAGKSTVAGLLAAVGFPVLDADTLAHELYVPGSPLVEQLVRAFGEGVRDAGGGIDRRALGGRVFGDRAALAVLNGIVHPPLLAGIRSRLETLDAGGADAAVVEAALLLQWGPPDFIDYVVCVTASRDRRRERLLAAGLAASAAERRLDSVDAIPDGHPGVDRILANDDDLDALRRRVAELATAIRQRARNRGGGSERR